MSRSGRKRTTYNALTDGYNILCESCVKVIQLGSEPYTIQADGYYHERCWIVIVHSATTG